MRHRFAICVSLLLLSLSAQARWDEHFTVRRKITVDTGAGGVPIAGQIGGSTVLVRLHDGDFQFDSVKEDGSDLRFVAADDRTPLAFHIEKFDSLLHEGLVWVRLPEIAVGGKTDFWIYYGNPAAAGAGDPKQSYDPDTVLVYHFAESNSAPVDSTSQANQALSSAPTVGCNIGNGVRLGTPAHVSLPASPSLVWTEGGAMTWSAWVKLTAVAPGATIFTREEAGRTFTIGAESGAPFVAVNGARAVSATALAPGGWHHLAVTASSGKIALFVDGESVAVLHAALPAMSSAAILGGTAAAEFDELEIARTARLGGWIQFAAIEQAGEKAAKLIVFGEDEKAGGNLLGDGHFAIIVRNLTPDGWAVIVVLGIMALTTWVVVVGKWKYLRRIATGNSLFLAEWRRFAGELEVIEAAPEIFGGELPSASQVALQRSPLFSIFRIGMQEVAQRTGSRAGGGLARSSLPAIRAELETGLVAESERLRSGIVLLTIAISGGPFLGLLGTVVGVMITFAAVAAAGEVNVNAIAPGIAAALLATVAGLAVAIPALFAYNYLLTRIKSATKDLHLFTESFVSKIAEQYHENS